MNDNTNVGVGKEQWELSYNFSGSGNWCSHYGEQFGNMQLDGNEQSKYFQKTKNKL